MGKKLLSIMLALAMLITSLSFEGSINKVKAADNGNVMADFTTGKFKGSNIEFVETTKETDESYTYAINQNGKNGIMIPKGKFAYFRTINNAILANQTDIIVNLTYYDEGNDYFHFQYNSNDTTNSLVQNYKWYTITKTDTKKWVTMTIYITNASFRQAQNNKCDFRISGGNSGTVISKVEIKKGTANPKNEPLGKRTGGNEKSEFKGKSFAGYQAWFGTNDRTHSWGHYAYGSGDEDGSNWPRKDRISIDVFPDVSEYSEDSIAQTGFDNLGSGKPTKLFDSSKQDVIDTHFRWMNEYGIDGAAIQRFVSTIKGKRIISNSADEKLHKIQLAAEKNDRLMYVMYDISGGVQVADDNDKTSISPYVEDIEFDWVYNIEKNLEMLNSKAYTTVNGKPVVCLWGMFGNNQNSRPNRLADYKELIKFFHDRGCYLIIGVSRDWRTGNNEECLNVLTSADMISPWMVGTKGFEGAYKAFVDPDLEYCKKKNIDYYPVIYSGFSWSLWQSMKPNATPRDAGQFLWDQAYGLKQRGLNSFYIAMFDEYDEGTAIAKNASDYFDIPKDQYFVTASADGYWCSTDFQLRTVGEAIKMMKNERSVVAKNPTPHSNGPIYYRNSFESKYANCKETKYNGYYPVDPCFKNEKQLKADGVSAKIEIEKNDTSKTGDYLTSFDGSASKNNASYLYRISETDIKVKQDMMLSYSIRVNNDAGKNTYVDLLLDDGTYVSEKSGSKDSKEMAAGSKKGVNGAWKEYTYNFGTSAIAGKKIVGVVLGYAGNNADFSADFDDIIIKDAEKDNASDNYVIGNIFEKRQATRTVNSDGLVGYGNMYTRGLSINTSDISDENLAVSFKLYIDSETEKNPLDVLKAPAGFVQIATAMENGKYLSWQARNIITQADGSPLKAGQWNDIILRFEDGSKDTNFDKSIITFFNFALAHLPKETGKHIIRIKDVNIVDTSRKAEKERTEWNTEYNISSIPYDAEINIKGIGAATQYIGVQKQFNGINASEHNPDKIQLQMDVEINNLTSPGNFAALMKAAGQIELSSSGTNDKNEISFNTSGINWTEGKNTIKLDLSQATATGGNIDLSNINYMRVYFVHFPAEFKDNISIKINNVKLIDTTNALIIPTLFSDGMLFQQNKPINIWGYNGQNMSVKLYKGNQLIQQKDATNNNGKWSVSLNAIKGNYDRYRFEILENGKVVKNVKDVLFGELWMAAGQSNMALTVAMDMNSESILADANNDNIRFFMEPTYPSGNTGEQPINPTKDIPGAVWGSGNNSAQVNRVSSVAYSFAKNLQEKLGVPVGFYNVAVGGSVIEAWISRSAIEEDVKVKKELNDRDLYYNEEWWLGNAGSMSTLYNQKVGPLTDSNIAGVIWYQGESNSNRSEIYDIEINLLKKSWSESFRFDNNSMPFIFTQVAPGRYDTGSKNNQHLGYLAQAMTNGFNMNDGKNMAMLTIYDLPLEHMKNGVSSDPIHPRTKQPVGERFFKSAINMVYGGGKEYTAPIYKSLEIKGDYIYLSFNHTGTGLKAKESKNLHGFTIAGEDGVYVNANAEVVDKNTVKVWNKYLKNPKNVIYAFDNFNQSANLVNSEGIPAAPFRTQKLNDTTLNPSTQISYFNLQGWMYADKNEWVYDQNNTDNKGVGYRPSWNVYNGTWTYDKSIKSEGEASIKTTYNKAGDVIIEPVLTYDSLKFDLSKYKNISFKIRNNDNRSKKIGLNIVSGGKTYTARLLDSGRAITQIESGDSFIELTYDLTQVFYNNTLVDGKEALKETTAIRIRLNDTEAGTVHIDDISVGMTQAIESENKPDTYGIVSKGKKTTASGIEAEVFRGDNMTDGDENTRWSSNFADDAWIIVDLKQEYQVDKVVLKWEAAYGKEYDILTSVDGKTWTKAESLKNQNGGEDTVTFNAIKARYVKMQGVKRALQYGYSLWEFEVYGK